MRPFALLLTLLATVLPVPAAQSATKATVNAAVRGIEQTAETQIRNLIEPVLEKYCRDDCKLMGVQVAVDLAVPDDVAPGFADVDPRSVTALAPESAKVRILMDEKIGPVSKGKLLELMQQYVEALEFPVRLDIQTTRFPQPVGSATKVAELRDRVTKRFKDTLDDLFKQFCPEQCLLGDLKLDTEPVNPEETQYGDSAEFVQDAGVAIRVKRLASTILIDDLMSPEERKNILDMAKLKTNFLRNVELTEKSMKFPRPLLGDDGSSGSLSDFRVRGKRGLASSAEKKESNSQTTQNATSSTQSNSSSTQERNESSEKQERFERIEKIERVENGDAVQKELEKFKVFGLIFACSILALLLFIALSAFRGHAEASPIQRVIQQLTSDPATQAQPAAMGVAAASHDERIALLQKRYEIERLKDELMNVFASQPKVAKTVFTRVLAEEGVETTAQYIQIFGESIVLDMLRDPSLQSDVAELMEYYARNPMEIGDDDQLELLKRLHNRAVAGKLVVLGSRTSNYFDFLAEMDGSQILELIRNESPTVKSIVMTQCDPQKRGVMFAQLDDDTKMKLMGELSRIDYLPRDYIHNVAAALKRKRRENPRLNTEALPGSEVLLTLLERTGLGSARTVMKQLESQNPESARAVKNKLVMLETLRFLRDGQLLEVVLSLKHDELLQFLKGTADEVRNVVLGKSPKDLAAELEEELAGIQPVSRESYQNSERKIINRMKIMANEGLINLTETNERMFAPDGAATYASAPEKTTMMSTPTSSGAALKKVAGW